MLADTTRDEEKAGIEERYGTAVAATSLRMHRTDEGTSGAVDVIAAAGMSPDRLGLALLRLHTEWTAAAKPERATLATIKANAAKIREADAAERANRERENGELARLERLMAEAPNWDLMVAIAEQKRLYEAKKLPMKPPATKGDPEARAKAEAARWYANELRLLMLNLRSRPHVLPQLTTWAADKGIPATAIPPAVLHWLDPTCGHCGGHGLLKAKDAPVLSAKQCRHCNATGTKALPPHSGPVLSHISQCVSSARTSIAKRLRR